MKLKVFSHISSPHHPFSKVQQFWKFGCLCVHLWQVSRHTLFAARAAITVWKKICFGCVSHPASLHLAFLCAFQKIQNEISLLFH